MYKSVTIDSIGGVRDVRGAALEGDSRVSSGHRARPGAAEAPERYTAHQTPAVLDGPPPTPRTEGEYPSRSVRPRSGGARAGTPCRCARWPARPRSVVVRPFPGP